MVFVGGFLEDATIKVQPRQFAIDKSLGLVAQRRCLEAVARSLRPGGCLVIEAFVPAIMAAGRGGHLVNVSSAAGLLGLPWHAAYSAAKFGLRGVSEVLRFDLAPHGIGVSLVCPGGVRTPLVGTVEIVGIDDDDPEIKKLKRRFERHAVSPEHVAEKILAGVEKNRYLVFTSADIRVAFWLQRWFPPAYEAIMRALNRRLVAAAGG